MSLPDVAGTVLGPATGAAEDIDGARALGAGMTSAAVGPGKAVGTNDVSVGVGNGEYAGGAS